MRTTLAVAAILAACSALAQTPAKRDFDAEARAAVQSAKNAAGFEFLGTLVRVCLLPQSGGEDASDLVPAYVANPAKAPERDSWYAEPARVFDNLYFVGGKIHSSWALTAREGIILIDTIYPYNSEELVVGGMKKLGLDPKSIRYVLVSHAHADHIGGAEMLQSRYGARIVMGGPDWDNVARFPNRYKTMAPKRDIVATDGMKITLGGETVTVWLTPGHTPGTISYTFERGVLGRHGFQFREQHAGPGHPEFPDLHRLAEAHGREGRRHRRDSAPLQPLRVRQRVQQEPHARGARQRSASVRNRGRLGAALLPGDAGLREGGADKA